MSPEYREWLGSMLAPEAFAELDKAEADLDRLQSKPVGSVTLAETAPTPCAFDALIAWVMAALEQWVSNALAFLILLISLMVILVMPYFLMFVFELFLIADVLYLGLMIYTVWCIWTVWPRPGSEG